MLFLRGFSDGDRERLAICIAMWAVDGVVEPKVLSFLIQEHLVREGTAVDFLCKVTNHIQPINTRVYVY